MIGVAMHQNNSRDRDWIKILGVLIGLVGATWLMAIGLDKLDETTGGLQITSGQQPTPPAQVTMTLEGDGCRGVVVVGGVLDGSLVDITFARREGGGVCVMDGLDRFSVVRRVGLVLAVDDDGLVVASVLVGHEGVITPADSVRVDWDELLMPVRVLGDVAEQPKTNSTVDQQHQHHTTENATNGPRSEAADQRDRHQHHNNTIDIDWTDQLDRISRHRPETGASADR